MSISFATDNISVSSPAKRQNNPVGWTPSLQRLSIDADSAFWPEHHSAARPAKLSFITADMCGHKNLEEYPGSSGGPVHVRVLQFFHQLFAPPGTPGRKRKESIQLIKAGIFNKREQKTGNPRSSCSSGSLVSPEFRMSRFPGRCFSIIRGQKISVVNPAATSMFSCPGRGGSGITTERAIHRTVSSMLMVKSGQKKSSGIPVQIGTVHCR